MPRAAPTDQRITDRWFWCAMLLTLLIVLPRSLSIANSHSESYDDQYHLVRGLVRFTHEEFRDPYNDPPLGEMILAVPMWVTGCTLDASRHDLLVIAKQADPRETILYGQHLSPEKLQMMESAWKALLFLPGAAVIFIWCRRLYGLHAAWLTLAAVLADPSIAAQTAVIALDVLGTEAILIACYLAWRYFESPNTWRLVATCAAMAAAMLIKIPATIALIAFVVYAVIYWVIRERFASAGVLRAEADTSIACHPERTREGSSTERSDQILREYAQDDKLSDKSRLTPASRRQAVVLAILLIPLFMWAFTLFDFSRPNEHAPVMSANYTSHWNFAADVVNANAMRRWPLGIYVAALIDSHVHSSEGHLQYLMGQVSMHGWWYYQFVTSALKIPVGIAAMLVIGLISLFKIRFRFAELSLLIPAILAGALLIASPIDVGFRHVITTYVLLIMLASRCVMMAPMIRRWVMPIAWLGITASAMQGMAWHPDEFAFVNLPWRNPQSIISDSNTDWGQSLKQVRAWMDANPNPGRPIYVAYFGPDTQGVAFIHYLGDRAIWMGDDPPHHGLLIVSPVLVWGAYAPADRYAEIAKHPPIAIIGHCMRVYDLDAIYHDPAGDSGRKIE